MGADRLRDGTSSRTAAALLGLGHAAGLSLAIGLCLLVARAVGQTFEFSIEAPDPVLLQEGSEVPLAVAIGSAARIPAGSRLSVVSPGLQFEMSPGTAEGRGWTLDPSQLPGLKIKAPIGVSGRDELHFALVRDDGAVIGYAMRALVIENALASPPPIAAASEKAAPRPEPAPAAHSPLPAEPATVASSKAPQPAPVPTAAAPQQGSDLASTRARKQRPALAPAAAAQNPIAAPQSPAVPPSPAPATTASLPEPDAIWRFLIEQGERQIADGNVALARQYYQRAAEGGSTAAAMRLAETYDPQHLSRLRIVGLRPDPAEALRWYERAARLGAAGAAERVEVLRRP